MYYKCDPKKATTCSKRNCVYIKKGDCEITSNPEWAVDKNKPLESYEGWEEKKER